MYSTRLLLKIIAGNILLVLAIGIYGDITDEALAREIGHAEWLYDYLWWFALALNELSGYVAACLCMVLFPGADHLEARYLAQYGIWSLLLTLQWTGYHAAAVWSCGHRSAFARGR